MVPPRCNSDRNEHHRKYLASSQEHRERHNCARAPNALGGVFGEAMKHIEATGIHPAAGDIRCVKHVCCEADAAVRTRQFDSVVERRAYGGMAAGFEIRMAIRKK